MRKELELLQSLNSPYVEIDPAFESVVPNELITYLKDVQNDPNKADDLATMFANATCDILTRQEFDKVHAWLFSDQINNEWSALKQNKNFLFITESKVPNPLPDTLSNVNIMDFVELY